MAMMDRPRGLPDNPAQGRRAVLPLLPPPQPPSSLTSFRDVAPPPPPPNNNSNSSLTTSPPLSSSQVIALAREAMRIAHENEAKAAEASGVIGNSLKPGLTIDLSRKKIQKLPEEIVDIIKDELERLALSHNYLQTFPARFVECTSLRYLNVRQNRIKEFPLALCDLKSLEILDLGRNMLQVLPPEIVKLSSLKVFSLPKNEIAELPLCLADMPSLSVVKLEGNPLVFPPPDVLQVYTTNSQNEGATKESELTEVTITAQIKKFLKQKAASQDGRMDSPNDEPTEGTETPRPTIKRVFSGRFPIKVNGTDVPDMRSPALPRPPMIPTRSHYRGLSQQNSAQRRPGVMPLTIGNPNERVRSNSETAFQVPRGERPESRSESRSRRMGIVSKKPSELSTLDEMQVNNRFSHYRGLSHGSAMQGNGGNMAAKSPSPASPADSSSLQRPVYVRRLSILPERRRESKVYDPVLEAAKGILYSIFQIHPMIQMLMSLANDGTAKRSSLEVVFYNTNSHVEQLELEIQKHDPMAEDSGYGYRENENVQRACITLVNAYTHVCSILTSNVDLFLDNGDPRYIRTLLTQLYNSIMELRVTCTQLSPDANVSRVPSRTPSRAPSRAEDLGATIRARSRENSITPTAGDRTPLHGRSRNGTFVYHPSNLRVATDVPMPFIPYINGTGRTATISAATPRSGESFASSSTSGGRNASADFTEEDRKFEKIFLSLQKSSDMLMKVLPNLNAQFGIAMRNAIAQRCSEHTVACWRALIAKCATSIQQTEMLKSKLSSIKLKEPGIRTQASFWALCNSFIDSWYLLVKKIMSLINEIQLPLDTRARLRPIQQSMKETWDLMLTSPWGYFTRQSGLSEDGRVGSPYSSHSGSGSGTGTVVPLPMTPQSAALGPAVQATVPSTPQSASFQGMFNGNVFERADTLIQGGGLNMSRSGTMNSGTSTASLNSISSTLSSQEPMTPASAHVLSPLGPGVPFRLYGNGNGQQQTSYANNGPGKIMGGGGF
ncbi:RAM signaling pathway protein-domain-containing protein [Diplogelasinospora grovesii]|uniref:RAM signaling pathway protein-domain-containing protein n=1 Tax=Diplogelasinospora grovesii TaxID=303347 RepID=A0AAN6S606_9PEZI|nr:RAM signaling pathway protein-domain-containing protein [Diplogelasinospora grovesii]